MGHAPELRLHNYLGDLIRVQPLLSPMFGGHSYAGHHALIHYDSFRHAMSLGVVIRMGQSHWNQTAGVVLYSGEK